MSSSPSPRESYAYTSRGGGNVGGGSSVGSQRSLENPTVFHLLYRVSDDTNSARGATPTTAPIVLMVLMVLMVLLSTFPVGCHQSRRARSTGTDIRQERRRRSWSRTMPLTLASQIGRTSPSTPKRRNTFCCTISAVYCCDDCLSGYMKYSDFSRMLRVNLPLLVSSPIDAKHGMGRRPLAYLITS